jgi:protein TonB
MLTHLIESQHPRQFREASTLFSLALHTLLIVAAIKVTTTAAREVQRVVAEKVTFAELKKQEPPPEQPKTPPPPGAIAAPPLAKGFQVLVAPVKIPDVLPEIDLSKATTREEDFSGSGVAGGIAKGVVGGEVRKVTEDQPYFVYDVEKAAMGYETNQGPRYPESLRAANVEGTVKIQFVVDTSGHAESGSLRILASTHPLFTEAVRRMLPAWRFYPAEVGGRKVRMLVEQPIDFRLMTRDAP